MAHSLSAASEPSPADVPPQLHAELAGRYQLDGRIGEGGMGVVYRGRTELLGTPVAIKVLRAQFSQDPSVLERFRREALSAGRIDSPHVVTVLDFGRLPSGSAYIVMEHLEGLELGELLQDLGVFDWDRARDLALQLCQVLGRAHAAGIVHRDLKPENVLVLDCAGRDFVKVVDFGIAKVRGEAAITMAGSALGTPGYMSPEQCCGEPADGRSDIYSLGVMLYEMLAGQLPFDHESLPMMLLAHMQETPAPVRTHASYLPAAVDGLLARCLAKKPSDRFATMEELADAIRAIAPDEVSAVRARPSPVPSDLDASRTLAYLPADRGAPPPPAVVAQPAKAVSSRPPPAVIAAAFAESPPPTPRARAVAHAHPVATAPSRTSRARWLVAFAAAVAVVGLLAAAIALVVRYGVLAHEEPTVVRSVPPVVVPEVPVGASTNVAESDEERPASPSTNIAVLGREMPAAQPPNVAGSHEAADEAAPRPTPSAVGALEPTLAPSTNVAVSSQEATADAPPAEPAPTTPAVAPRARGAWWAR